MINIDEEIISNILQSSKSESIFLKSLSVYKFNKTNIYENSIILFLCTIVSVIFAINTNTVLLVNNSVSIFLNVSLTMFGIIFTGYAIFQTLLSNRLVIHLFEDTISSENNIIKSKLQETNENFVYLMMLFIFGIISNIILSIIMPILPLDYCLFKSRSVCIIIATILIDIFLYIMGIMIWRMVSFISNIFHLFNAYAVARLIEAMSEEENQE